MNFPSGRMVGFHNIQLGNQRTQRTQRVPNLDNVSRLHTNYIDLLFYRRSLLNARNRQSSPTYVVLRVDRSQIVEDSGRSIPANQHVGES